MRHEQANKQMGMITDDRLESARAKARAHFESQRGKMADSPTYMFSEECVTALSEAVQGLGGEERMAFGDEIDRLSKLERQDSVSFGVGINCYESS